MINNININSQAKNFTFNKKKLFKKIVKIIISKKFKKSPQ